MRSGEGQPSPLSQSRFEVAPRISCWQVYQDVSVFGIHVVDDHIDSFAFGIVGEEPRYFDCGRPGEYRLASPGCPGQMNPAA
jgi:hypothetical protein